MTKKESPKIPRHKMIRLVAMGLLAGCSPIRRLTTELASERTGTPTTAPAKTPARTATAATTSTPLPAETPAPTATLTAAPDSRQSKVVVTRGGVWWEGAIDHIECLEILID